MTTRDADAIRNHHSQTSIDNRRNSHPRPRDPDEIHDPVRAGSGHDYYPSRKPDDDTCSVCGRVYNAAVHIPIGPEDPGEV